MKVFVVFLVLIGWVCAQRTYHGLVGLHKKAECSRNSDCHPPFTICVLGECETNPAIRGHHNKNYMSKNALMTNAKYPCLRCSSGFAIGMSNV